MNGLNYTYHVKQHLADWLAFWEMTSGLSFYSQFGIFLLFYHALPMASAPHRDLNPDLCVCGSPASSWGVEMTTADRQKEC